MTWHDWPNQLIRPKWSKPVAFVLCTSPAAYLLCEGVSKGLSTEFTASALSNTGVWALNFLGLTLLITPLGRLFCVAELFRFRRMLGLFSFFYGSLHLFAWSRVHHRPEMPTFDPWNLRIAFVGFVLMIPLAATSTAASIRWLGGKRWRTLHSLVYVSAVTSLVHYLGLATNHWKPVIYGLVFGLLLAYRIVPNVRRSLGTKKVEASRGAPRHDIPNR